MKYMEIRKEERKDWTRAGQNRGTSQDLKAVSEEMCIRDRSAVDIYREIIKDNIDYHILKQDMKFDSCLLYTSSGSGSDRPLSRIRGRLKSCRDKEYLLTSALS